MQRRGNLLAVVVEREPAGGKGQQARDSAQQRRLARAVGPRQDQGLTIGQGEVDGFHDAPAASVHADIFGNKTHVGDDRTPDEPRFRNRARHLVV